MKLILLLLLLWAMNACTAAMVQLEACKKACPGNMASFEQLGDTDLSCQCYRRRAPRIPG